MSSPFIQEIKTWRIKLLYTNICETAKSPSAVTPTPAVCHQLLPCRPLVKRVARLEAQVFWQQLSSWPSEAVLGLCGVRSEAHTGPSLQTTVCQQLLQAAAPLVMHGQHFFTSSSKGFEMFKSVQENHCAISDLCLQDEAKGAAGSHPLLGGPGFAVRCREAVTASDAGLRAPALHMPWPGCMQSNSIFPGQACSRLQLLFLRYECITEITGNIPGKQEKW